MAREALKRFGGREIDPAGDGFFASFDVPAAAVHCAGAIVDGMWDRGLAIRAGVHTGECEWIGRKLGGIAVHIGSRVASLAGPGEILVTSTVRDLVTGARIDFDERGRQALRGVPGEWSVSAVRQHARPPLDRMKPEPESAAAPGRPRRRRAVSASAVVALVAVAVGLIVVTRDHGDHASAGSKSGSGSRDFVGLVGVDPNGGRVDGRIAF